MPPGWIVPISRVLALSVCNSMGLAPPGYVDHCVSMHLSLWQVNASQAKITDINLHTFKPCLSRLSPASKVEKRKVCGSFDTERGILSMQYEPSTAKDCRNILNAGFLNLAQLKTATVSCFANWTTSSPAAFSISAMMTDELHFIFPSALKIMVMNTLRGRPGSWRDLKELIAWPLKLTIE